MRRIEKILTKNGKVQMSEAFLTTVFLTLSGGFQDAYTYLCRDEVFANAQTGNIVLLTGSLFTGNFKEALRYLIPLLSFVLGIFVAEFSRTKLKNITLIHWRQVVLIAEMIILFAVGFISQKYNLFASALVSFVCAMQVQTFRKVNGNPYASTMCIGNLRSGVNAFYNYTVSKKKSELKKATQYFGVIFLFGIGAGMGTVMTNYFGEKAIIMSSALLFISFLMMFVRGERPHTANMTGR